eukprot:jgi/Botrbrau1/23658/Bobra.55_2s0041.1
MVALRRTQWRSALLQPVPQYHPAPELPHDKVRTIIFRLWHRMQAMLAASYSLCLTVLKNMAPQHRTRWSAPLQPVPQSQPAPPPELPDDLVRIIISPLPLKKLAKLAASSSLCLGVLKEWFKDVDCLRGYRPHVQCTCALSLQQLLWTSTLLRRFCRSVSLETGEPLDSTIDHHTESVIFDSGFLSFGFKDSNGVVFVRHLDRVSGAGRCAARPVSMFHCGSLVQAGMRLCWVDDDDSCSFHGLNFELRSLGGDGEPYLEVHPINWAWGKDDEMLRTLLTLLLAPEDLLALVGEGHAVPSGPPPPPVHLHLCPACTSVGDWCPPLHVGMKVRWDQPFNLFHPEPLLHTCTCWNLHTRDDASWFFSPDIRIPPCYGPR